MVIPDVSMTAWLYILRLKSGNLYVGATTNLKQRYRDHLDGHACRTTKADPPITLLHSEPFENFKDARKREAQIKRWSKAKKEALIAGEIEKLRSLSKSRNKCHPSLKVVKVVNGHKRPLEIGNSAGRVPTSRD